MDKQNWLEVSFHLTGELAEPVAEILNRFAHQGVVIEQDKTSPKQDKIRVFAYLLVDETLEEKKEQIERGIFHLNQILPIPAPTYKAIHDQDWMASWQKFYKPVAIAEKMVILPAWIEKHEEFGDRIPIRINPGMAFGTGTHPTTQLSLALLEEYIQPGQKIIDIGCGSGVLSIAGILLGAEHSLAVDINPAAYRSTIENAKLNKVKDQIETAQASVEEILAGKFSYQEAPIVVANILTKVLLKLFDDGLGELVTENGALLLSGLLVDQILSIEEKARANGFKRSALITQGDWAGIAFKKIS